MSDAGEEAQSTKQITFNVKSSSDSKYVITVAEDITILDLKNKLSTTEYADIPAERQRLIYSGRVLKDADPLSTYKIKDGNTVHMVKGAASSQRQNPQSQGASSTPGSSNPASNVPTSIATGTGTDPLAGLTGARYAGFAQLPGAGAFGPDGGMGPSQSPEDLERMLSNPMFAQQMNEAMNHPEMIRQLQQNPMVRNNPWLREQLNNPEFRRMMMDPAVIRQSMQMQQQMMGGRQGGNMPAPGVTDTTPQGQQQGGAGQNQGNNNMQNPFQMGLGGGLGMGMGAGGQQGNPFAAMFGGGAGGMALPSTPGSTGTAATGNTTSPPTQASQGDQARSPEQAGSTDQQQQNPFGGMFGMPQGGEGQQNPLQAMTQQMMRNPQMMQQAMQMMNNMGGMGGMGPQSPQQGEGQGQGQGAQANPFASMFGGGQGNPSGGMGAFGGGQPQQPQDSRPPEEQYADQLRQLNDMGFFEFERNVRALRMAGGRVEGAIEILFSGTI